MDETHDDEIIHRELDTTRDSPGAAIAEIVAGLEDTDSDELASVWRRIDDMLRPLFSDPPSPDTQLVVTFSYEGYRITVEQNGTARFVKISE